MRYPCAGKEEGNVSWVKTQIQAHIHPVLSRTAVFVASEARVELQSLVQSSAA